MAKDVIDSGSSAFSPCFKIVPDKVLVDEIVSIRLLGFETNQLITVRARMKDDLGKQWESYATFKADGHGVVDVNSQKPLSGTYDGVDPMGLFWSMAMDPNEKKISIFMKRTLTPIIVTLTAEVDGKTIASGNLERSFIAPNITGTPIRENGLVGTFFHSSDSGPRPGVIVLSGSSGGALEHYASLLASHGYAALALAYFAMEDLPTELVNIPLEYFEKAIHWMQGQETVDGDKLAVMGRSRGGELSLLLGATFPEIKTVIAFVPSGIIWAGLPQRDGVQPAWTHHGKPLPFVSPGFTGSSRIEFEQKVRAGMPIRLTPYFLKGMEDEIAVEKATIPVEKINGPVLLISGQDDQMWPSSFFCKLVIDRLDKHNHLYPYKHLNYKGAGHMIGPDFMPKTFTIMRHPVKDTLYELGGNAKDYAFASSDSWSKTMRFLGQKLKQ